MFLAKDAYTGLMKTVTVRHGEFLETTASCSRSLNMTRDREAQEDLGASSRGLLRGLGQRAGGGAITAAHGSLWLCPVLGPCTCSGS